MTHDTLKHLNFLNPSLKLLPYNMQYQNCAKTNYTESSEELGMSRYFPLFYCHHYFQNGGLSFRSGSNTHEKCVVFDISILVYNISLLIVAYIVVHSYSGGS